MTLFTQSGDAFIPTVARHAMQDKLPTGNFLVVQPPMGPMYFQQVEQFPKAGRMYGDVHKRADRIMRTFLDRPRATGVLLEGEKGSGKSQLARVISETGYDAGIPTILVNDPYFGDGFNKLIAAVEQPAIVIFDEFEKVYRDQEHQEAILTLLDGVMTTQKLFIFTVNNKYRVNDHMHNRPGRLFYSIEYRGLEPNFIREYCEENLENQDNADGVLTMSAMFSAFNFDMLKAMVEEMNRYDETAFEVVELLNTKPYSHKGNSDTYEVFAIAPSGAKSNVTEISEIPITGGVSRGEAVSFYAKFAGVPEWDDNDHDKSERALKAWERELLGDSGTSNHIGSDGEVYIIVEQSGLRKVDVDAGRYQFVAKNGMTVEFKRKDKPVHNYNPAAW